MTRRCTKDKTSLCIYIIYCQNCCSYFILFSPLDKESDSYFNILDERMKISLFMLATNPEAFQRRFCWIRLADKRLRGFFIVFLLLRFKMSLQEDKFTHLACVLQCLCNHGWSHQRWSKESNLEMITKHSQLTFSASEFLLHTVSRGRQAICKYRAKTDHC